MLLIREQPYDGTVALPSSGGRGALREQSRDATGTGTGYSVDTRGVNLGASRGSHVGPQRGVDGAVDGRPWEIRGAMLGQSFDHQGQSRDDVGTVVRLSWQRTRAIIEQSRGDSRAVLGRSWDSRESERGIVSVPYWSNHGGTWGYRVAIRPQSRGDPGTVVGESADGPGAVL